MAGRVNKFTSAYQNHSNVTDEVVAMMEEKSNDVPEEKSATKNEQPNETSPKTKDTPSKETPNVTEKNNEQPAIRPMGRPKVYDYKMHPLQTRIREDLYEYAQEQCGKGKKFQSVNAYINELILKDMQNNQ